MDEGGEQIENTVLFGKYQLVRLLGKGRSGTVYLALHLELKEYRAVKRVPKVSVGYEEFKKEALLLSSLDHAGIPKVYDLEEDESYSYLIEEYLEGESLYALVKSQGYLNQEAVLRIGVQVCDLVHYLHSAGETPVLYLDLQPGNLLFCHGCVKLLDFDHADRLDEANRSRRDFVRRNRRREAHWASIRMSIRSVPFSTIFPQDTRGKRQTGSFSVRLWEGLSGTVSERTGHRGIRPLRS